ncbi:MAG: hypothetical protein ACM3SQ_04665 [Betaproteobacteria bacterium]
MDYWENWLHRSDRAKAEQPHWITPLATTTPRLEQEFRYDVLWQQARPGAPYAENFGNGKGLELIPFDKVEVIVGVPPYIAHHNPSVEDGFGDLQFLVKYRLLAAGSGRGDYIVTAFMGLSVPGGNSGQSRAIVTPTLAYGKGFGRFDVQGTVGAGLPAGDEARIGRTYTWNNAFQYRLFRRLWPEVEVNAAFFQDGPNAGRHQMFLTPGLVVGAIPLTGRLGLTVGAGVQIATTAFHTSTHNVVLSVRLPF